MSRKGTNLFKVNGVEYTDNIPDNMKISITKESYIEYLQLKENNVPYTKIKEKLDMTIDKRAMLGYKTFIKGEDMIREDSILLGKEEAYKELLKGGRGK